MFRFSLQLLSDTFVILDNNLERDVVTNVDRSSRKVPVVLVTF